MEKHEYLTRLARVLEEQGMPPPTFENVDTTTLFDLRKRIWDEAPNPYDMHAVYDYAECERRAARTILNEHERGEQLSDFHIAWARNTIEKH